MALALVSCAHPAATGKPTKLKAFLPPAEVPALLTRDNYQHEREKYDTLPPDTPGRGTIRAMLMEYLLSQARRQQARKASPDALFKTFLSLAALYHPREIYKGKIVNPGLSKLCAHLMQLFSPRGDEEKVLQPMVVRLSLEPQDAVLTKKYDLMTRWIDETQQLTHGQSAKGALLIKIMENAARVWPSAFVVETLRELYIERRITFAQALNGSSHRRLRRSLPAILQGSYFYLGFHVARLYLWVDQPYEALKRLREVLDESDHENELRQLLERAVSPAANVKDQIQLSEYFEEKDPDVALKICQAAAERFPGQAAALECAGKLAATLKRPLLAIRNLERAVALTPEDLSLTKALASQYHRHLFDLIGDEKLEQAKKRLALIEAFYGKVEARFKAPLQPPLSKAHYAIGHGFYNAGKIDQAIAAFKRSIATEASPEVNVQLAVIQIKRGQGDRALKLLTETEALPMQHQAERIYWQGRIDGLRGQILRAAGQQAESAAALKRSLAAWAEWQNLGLHPGAKAEALVHMARSFYLLGERAAAMDALDQAIDVKPDRKETYADVIALLATFGHLPEALDAYHRALGRAEVSEYLKTYCSFWIIGLARRAGVVPDALAVAHLRGLRGDKWYVRLAQLFLGKKSYEQLLVEADTVGKQAELHFYWAEELLARGAPEAARALWQKVLGTDMMAFYEYDMAAFDLKFGPSKVTPLPVDRKQKP